MIAFGLLGLWSNLYNFEREPYRLASNLDEPKGAASSKEIVGKYTLTKYKGYIYSRRIGVNKGNSILCFEITEPYFITTDNKKIYLPFISLTLSIKEYSLGLSGMLSYLSTANSNLSASMDSIVVDVSSYASKARELINNKLNINAYVRDLNTNKTYKLDSLVV